jgi:hypothetical protein
MRMTPSQDSVKSDDPLHQPYMFALGLVGIMDHRIGLLRLENAMSLITWRDYWLRTPAAFALWRHY